MTGGRWSGWVRVPLLLWGFGLLMLVGVAPAVADAPSAGGDVSVAQTLGDRELTVVLRRVTSVPGPLQVEVVTHAGTAGGQLTLDATPTGASSATSTLPAPGAPTSRGTVDLGAAPGMYSATLRVDRPGPWELAVGDGTRVARIPFIVPKQVTTPPERLVYGGFLAAGVLLPVSIVVAVRARRTAWALLPAGGMVAGIAVAVTAGVLSSSLPLPPQPGVQLDPSVDNVGNPYALGQPLISDFSRPPVMLALGGAPLSAGRAGDLDLYLTDAATGAPVDDLIIEDSALIHLLIVGPTGELAHLHPIRIAPGHYQIHLTPPEAGHYALSAELARRGGGVQMVRAATGFDVQQGNSPAPLPNTAATVHLGGTTGTATTAVGPTPITVVTTDAVAGAPITLTATVGSAGDLQPWLGMVGHMIVAGPLPPSDADIGTAVQNAQVWGHAHSMGGMSMAEMNGPGTMPDMPGMTGMTNAPSSSATPGTNGGAMLMLPVNGDSAPDETVAAYGPGVPFTYTFTTPGEYRVWIQVERNYTVLTIPVVLDVAASGASR
ncbi:hypothetical protein KO481_38320 [Nocardia sp. NEAU-G5]|uniref:Secreted protein n=1 Tax=Nocardia albiluteola TaxID=2842303 RepID=A0ABS6BC61_9NOCA|nr:hypothetical protein [Nocardia albiluteola]MBU3067365.1 hypothetical protein [Nocardia albiluteola]